MVVCQERGADLRMAQPMPLSLAPVKSRLVLPFWYRLTQVVLEKRPLNGCSYVGFGLSIRCINLLFIIPRHPSFAKPK